MPRRGFFRGAGGEKKNSKKQNKLLQQKHVQQQQQQHQIQQQQQQQKRLSGSQSSLFNPTNISVNDDNGEQQQQQPRVRAGTTPPLGLDGPRQTAPSSHLESRPYDPRLKAPHQQQQQKSPSSPPGVVPAANNEVDQIHRNNEQQFLYQHQAQSSIPNQNQLAHYHQSQQHRHYEESTHGQQFSPSQLQQHVPPPFAGQQQWQPSYQSHAESPQQLQQQQAQQQHQRHPVSNQHQMPHPGSLPPSMPPQHNVLAQNVSPTVDDAIDEIWRCETDDFRSASHTIQMLRLAIVAEWESQQLMDRGNPDQQVDDSNRFGGGTGRKTFSYDPSDTFLSLQGATLRFHARFESMKSNRDAIARSSTSSSPQKLAKQQLGPRDNESESVTVADSTTVNTHASQSTLNGVEWELAEQAAWEVWEESVRASAALTHACVGPAWRRQLRLRRQLIRESEMRLLHQPHLQQHHYRAGFAHDGMSVGGSSAGGTSMASSFLSVDVSNPQSSSGRFVQHPGGGTGSVQAGAISPPTPPVWRPPTDILEMLSFAIPEVLPAAMIRFAASVIETSIPPLRSARTRIFWDSDKVGIASGTGGNKALPTTLGQHLQDERRWLRRRKRLGDTQRDLAFGLFCGENENNDKGNHRVAEEEGANGENKWSIPGAHTPVAVMIDSWLETCQAWPIPKVIEDGNIPYHFEEVSNDLAIEEGEGGNIASTADILPSLNMDSSSGIPGKRNKTPEQSYRKFSLWGEIVDISIDWWYTLRVLRDCSDLVSAGWRPPPSGRIGEGIILSLISISERGISHLAGDNAIEREMTIDQIRKERLLACSCASESLMAMKTLASREVIPQATLRPLATSLCQLISAAETATSSLSSCGSKPREEDVLLEKEILTQRTSVASNSAELLWVLLSNESTNNATTDALLDAIDIDLHVEITDANRAYVEERVVMACGAIRALSAAMWGDPPSVKGVPLLRFLWEPIIELYGSVASTFFQGHSEATTTKFDIAGHETSALVIDEQIMCNGNQFLNIVFEIVLAFQRLVDSEMGDLCATEWESFVRAIDIGIAPWLVRRGAGSSSIAEEIRMEALAIFSQISCFLGKCSEMENGFNPPIYLYLFLLRKIAPLIQTIDSFSQPLSHPSSMAGDDATTLALAVIKSWCVIRYLPFKQGDWLKRAGDFLAEAFVVPETQPVEGYHYIGGYLHHPIVRLEALKSLVDDDSTDIDYSTIRDSDSVSTSGISTITPVSLRSGHTPPPVFSLFSLTKNLRELHLVLVNSIILPRLEETLSITRPILETTECQPSQSLKKVSTAECFHIIEKEFLLRRFAVKMLGTLFRSRTGDGEKRHKFIELLQNAATNTPYGIRDWVHQKSKDSIAKPKMVELSLVQVFIAEEINLRIEAIRQIEICLGASFSTLPHTHANVPDILKAICDTARFYSIDYKDDEIDGLLLTLASILPLARLSCARNANAMLMSRQHVTSNIPEDILSFVSVDEWLHNVSPMVLNETLPIVSEESDFNSDHGDIAPFVFVKHHANGKEDNQSSENMSKHTRRRQTRRHSSNPSMNGKQGTIVDFEPVASVIKHVLHAVSCCHNAHQNDRKNHIFDRTLNPSSLAQLPSILCTICYSVMSDFLTHGMAFPSLDDLLWLDLDSSSDKVSNENELVSRSQAVSDFAAVLGWSILARVEDEENSILLARRGCGVLVQLSMSKCHKIVQNACCGLISILSSLRHSFAKKRAKGKLYDAEINDCLLSFIDHVCLVLQGEGTSSDQVLIPLIDAMRETVNCAGSVFDFPRPLRRRAFLILFQPTREKWEVQVVAFQCCSAIINTLSLEEVSLMMFFAIGPEKNVKLPSKQRIQPLLIDLLRYRLMSAPFLRSSCNSEGSYKPSRVHNRLAREALSLEQFPVDLDDLGKPKASAFKCGNAILTLRLGSKDSLHRGWVEVVVRSPCSRIRRLAKWKKESITENPDSTLPFWEQLHSRSKGEAKKEVLSERGDTPVQNVESEATHFVESEESLNIMHKARTVLARFDNLVEGATWPQHSGKIINSAAQPDELGVTNSRHHRPFCGKTNSFYGEKKYDDRKSSEASSSLKRTRSDGDLMALSFSNHPEMLYERKRSVYSWLQCATGQDDIDNGLINELEALGFSRSELGAPETVITAMSHQDLFVHEQLRPFTIGSNFNRAISILDRVTPFQTHRIALFYGGSFSTKRSARKAKSDSNADNDGDKFLMSTQASTDFWQFSKELGDLVPVRHCKYFSGGLDTSESLSDGSFAIVWFGCQGGSYEVNDPILVDSMVIFHTVTLMPDRLTNRKRHVGNDVVHIVYGLDIDTLDVDHERMAISGHFGFITIYVIPLVHVPLFKVSVHLKAGLDKSICSALDHLVGSWLISRRVGAHFVRNLAMQADVICQSMNEDKLGLVLNSEDRDGRIRDTERHLA